MIDINQSTTNRTTGADAWIPQQHQANEDVSVDTAVHNYR